MRGAARDFIVGKSENSIRYGVKRPAMLNKNLKATVSRPVLLALALCSLVSIPALAQDAPPPVFTPASGWTVGASQVSNVRGLKGIKLPCVASTEYDNGFVVRFSGGGGQILAMAVDFRQNVFTQGKKYNAMLSVGESYAKQVSASAFTGSTLIFNLRPLGDFYSVSKNAPGIEIDIEGNKMGFSLGQLAKAYADLESCYTGGNAQPVPPIGEGVRSASAQPVPAVEKPAALSPMPPKIAANETNDVAPNAPTPLPTMAGKNLPKSFKDIVQNDSAKPDPIAPRISRAEASAIAPRAPLAMPPSAPTPVVAATVWDAKAGEDMRAVLSRWASRAGYDLDWQSTQNGRVAQDLKLNGSFEDAVSQLLAENSAATGMDAHVETATGDRKDLGSILAQSASAPMAPAVAPIQAAIPAYRTSWTAPAGANLQAVLDDWAAKAGVSIVWQSYENFPVKKAVSVNGSFEEAVQSLLDQYGSDSRRPLGQLNIDPSTGARTLLMDAGA
ncbi:MAG: hypothetical protein DI551_02140 [Micavibrio aeruginosavorus]|uniref:Toxin co-regulated pilus biosynthesis protein Q C-terminal domain-containing protein n=1 Tax=Micavibrio aeruginosavorus TaxID=349221 RepID=A0A2W5N4R0_9BACT|nr:MAG: hypothetical protein DI551_02140 [Micavibrio aeruginosavorus]